MLTNRTHSTTRPTVTKLDTDALMCAWCWAIAVYDVDGTTACLSHYTTAHTWAEAKRIGR